MTIPEHKRRKAGLKWFIENDARFKGTDISYVMDAFPSHMFSFNQDVSILPVCFNSVDETYNCMFKVHHFNSREKAKEVFDITKRVGKNERIVKLKSNNPIPAGDNLYGIPMELYAGNLWHDFISHQGPLEEDQFLGLFSDGVKGLSTLHRKKVVHSDMKPTNILATSLENPRWVISDFGSSNMGLNFVTLSGKNAECFRSPELRALANQSGFVYDETEDIFAFGVTLYIALSGEEFGFERLFNESRKGLEYREFIDETIRKSLFDPRIKEILKMFVGPKRPKQLPRGTTWKDYRYYSGIEGESDLERFVRFQTFSGADISEDKQEGPSIKLHSETYLGFLEEIEKMLDLVARVNEKRTGKNDNLPLDYIESLIQTHIRFARYAKDPEVRLVYESTFKILEAEEKYRLWKINEVERLMKQLQSVRGRNQFEREELKEIADRIYCLGWPATHRNREGLEGRARYSLQEIKQGNLPYQIKLNKLEELVDKRG